MLTVLLYTVIFFVFITGLCVGSFLNVVILRTLSNESIVFPASKCPKCGTPLLWWHNIPILSYIILRGKCNFCKEKISIQYPIVELLTGIIFVCILLKYGISWMTLYCWVIGCLFIVIAATDWKEKIVFDIHTYLLIILGLVYSIFFVAGYLYQNYSLLGNFDINIQFLVHNPLTNSLLGIIAGFIILELAARAGYIFAGTRAFGEGDSFIAAGLGSIFGWNSLLSILLISIIIQLLITVPIYIKKEIDNKNWMTIISLTTFIVYTIGFFTAEQFGWLSNSKAYIASALVLAGIGLFTCREVLISVRGSQNRTYLPFGPAMIIAGFITILL